MVTSSFDTYCPAGSRPTDWAVRELTAFGGPVIVAVDKSNCELLIWAATELQQLSVQWTAGDPDADGTGADGGDRGLAGDLVVTGLLTRGARDVGVWFLASNESRRRVDRRRRPRHDTTAIVEMEGNRVAWSTQRPPEAGTGALDAVAVDGREGWRCERLAATAASLDVLEAYEYLSGRGANGWLMTRDGIVWPIERTLGPTGFDSR